MPPFYGYGDAKHAALSGSGQHLDPAAVIGHDALRDGETETRPLPRRLRREERIEDPGENIVGNARPLVLEIVADGARANREAPLTLHRLEPVRRDTEKDLAELTLVDERRR